MITINPDRCTGCGICAQICHEGCMAATDSSIQIDHNLCSGCGQCIAICPLAALGWEGNAPEAFHDSLKPTPEQVDELLNRRRTIRKFKPEKPSQELLEKIAACGACAPAHARYFRMAIALEKDTLQAIDDAVFSWDRLLHRLIFQPRWIKWIAQKLSPHYLDEYLKAKQKIDYCLQEGRAFSNMPPAVIFVIGDRRRPLMLESAQYIAYNMNLFAEALGLGGRLLVGNQMFFNRDKKLRGLLGMNKNERIFAVLGLGYPAVQFRNKIKGRSYPIQWL